MTFNVELLSKRESEFMATAQENLANVSSDIALARTVIQGVSIFVDKVPQMIADAVAVAVANGATAAQVQPVSDLSDLLQAEANALVAKMATAPGGGPAPVGTVPPVV